MGEYTLTRLDKFTEMLNQLKAQYEGVEQVVAAAEVFLRLNASESGFSTGRDLRYYPTRSIPKVRPRLIMFFHVDEATKTVNLVSITEWPEEEP